jgi:hypothetical protein
MGPIYIRRQRSGQMQRSPSTPAQNCGPRARRHANARSRRAPSSPRRRCRSPDSRLSVARTRRSAPSCSSAHARSSATYERCSQNSESAPEESSAVRRRTSTNWPRAPRSIRRSTDFRQVRWPCPGSFWRVVCRCWRTSNARTSDLVICERHPGQRHCVPRVTSQGDRRLSLRFAGWGAGILSADGCDGDGVLLHDPHCFLQDLPDLALGDDDRT